MNLDKTYTVKSNAVRDMRKAIARGELAADASVVVVPAGWQIVLPYVAPTPAKPITPQVAALPGVTPLGLRAVAAPHVAEARAFLTKLDAQDRAEAEAATVAIKAAREAFDPAKADALLNGCVGVDKPAAAPQADKKDFALALTVALVMSRTYGSKVTADRVDQWVPFESVHNSIVPHGLSKSQMPASTGNARKRGMIDVAWSDQIGLGRPRRGMIKLTAAGLEAARTAHKGSN